MTFETITIKTLAKGSNLSRKAIVRAIEKLGVDVFCMRMKAYGHRGYVGQIKLNDAEKVIAEAVNFKEEPKQPRVSKQEQLKQNGFEIIAETKTNYRLSKDGITFSVGKYCSLEKILKKFEAKSEVKKEEKPVEEKPTEVKEDVKEEKPEEGFDEFFEDVEEEPEVKPEVKENAVRYEKYIPEITRAIEKEFPNTEVKSVMVFDKDDDTHYWVKWEGVEHNSNLGDIDVGFPLMEVITKSEKEEEMKEEKQVEVKKEEAVPMTIDNVYGEDKDPVTGIEGVEVEDDFGEKLQNSGCDSSFDINTLYSLYAKKDAETAKEKGRACEIKE